MNKVILSGRLATEPELKSTASGVSVCSVAVAVQRDYKNDEGEYIADFINVVLWRQQAEFISKHFTKGQSIEIIGELQTRSYTDKEGNNRKITEVLANKVYFGAKDNTR